MIRVWTDGQRAGALDRLATRGSTFAYEPGAPAARAVSVTMPVRVQSWDTDFGLAPIFEMNLPEGALRERLTRRFAKATGTFDDFDLLGVVGRNQIGRVRFSAEGQDLNENLPFQSIDEILRARRGGGLFDYLLSTFAEQSGISGVQPKVMIRASGKASDPKGRQSPSVISATHIVKLWDANEYPELAANESFCLQAATKLGLPVPHFELSDDGAALVIDRFDLTEHGYLGFEDFCVLNGLGTANKYKGSYETRIFKRAKEFLPQRNITDDLKQLFKLIVLNCAIRNGDAHLKNFGLIYDEVEADLRLAPTYDLVTTVAYLPKDAMALTMDGSTDWPSPDRLLRFGQTRADITAKDATSVFEQTADALSDTAKDLQRYFKNSEYEVGDRMREAWETGIHESLGLTRGLKPAANAQKKRPLAKSDATILEALRANGGALSGSLNKIASDLSMSPSTLGASVRRLAERGMIERSTRLLKLKSREV
ncbi:MAG: HipA domain-containing protein [Hyphomonadaceae bacterium]|nr:HipA domain-containing protein [Hyphomonadaceae bacterium]